MKSKSESNHIRKKPEQTEETQTESGMYPCWWKKGTLKQLKLTMLVQKEIQEKEIISIHQNKKTEQKGFNQAMPEYPAVRCLSEMLLC